MGTNDEGAGIEGGKYESGERECDGVGGLSTAFRGGVGLVDMGGGLDPPGWESTFIRAVGVEVSESPAPSDKDVFEGVGLHAAKSFRSSTTMGCRDSEVAKDKAGRVCALDSGISDRVSELDRER